MIEVYVGDGVSVEWGGGKGGEGDRELFEAIRTRYCRR